MGNKGPSIKDLADIEKTRNKTKTVEPSKTKVEEQEQKLTHFSSVQKLHQDEQELNKVKNMIKSVEDLKKASPIKREKVLRNYH